MSGNYARIEYSNEETGEVTLATGGSVIRSDLKPWGWEIELDLGGGRTTVGVHQYRDAAILTALAAAMGFRISVTEPTPPAADRGEG